jgi:hypothetical protein
MFVARAISPRWRIEEKGTFSTAPTPSIYPPVRQRPGAAGLLLFHQRKSHLLALLEACLGDFASREPIC